MLVLLIITSLLSTLCCAVLLRHAQGHAHRYGAHVPQRFHAGAVPRIGGVAMVLAWGAGWIWMALSENYAPVFALRTPEGPVLKAFWAAVLMAVGIGVAEDVTHKVPARWRFFFTFLAAAVAAIVMNLGVSRLDLGPVDRFWGTLNYLHLLVAIVAIGGLPHAFNLIDGYNGLAGTVAVICAVTLAYVCNQVGDRELAAFVLALAGATAGFLIWNYPRGLIFAGDGGAYFWGIVLAVVSLLLVKRHPLVSPWFPVLLLIYPCWEAVFSITRKITHGVSPGVADALHFHQLIYRRVVTEVFHEDVARRMLSRNNRTAPYLWGFALLTIVPAALFWRNTPVLIAFTLLFVVSYVWAYASIVRFRVQRYLPRRRRRR